jgi:hypothetical protein
LLYEFGDKSKSFLLLLLKLFVEDDELNLLFVDVELDDDEEDGFGLFVLESFN